jgi:hypothetical protein
VYEHIFACKINQSKITFHLYSVRSNKLEFLICSCSAAVSTSGCLQTNRNATWDGNGNMRTAVLRHKGKWTERMGLTLFNITISTEVDMYGVALSKWKKITTIYGGKIQHKTIQAYVAVQSRNSIN